MIKSLSDNPYDMDFGDLEDDFWDRTECDSPVARVVKLADGKYLATVVFDNGDIETIGTFDNRESAENSANEWVREYVNLDD
jgi:hypothetical protein